MTNMSDESILTNLNTLLANHMVLYVKIRNYYWNITGVQFYTIHHMIKEFYNQFAEMVDEIA